MSVFHTNALAGASGRQGAGGAAQYQIQRSLRFNSADSAYLSRTPASAGNRKTWTWSGWVKRTAFGALNILFSSGADGSNNFRFGFDASDKVFVSDEAAGVTTTLRLTTAVYRDPGAWMHIVLAVDTPPATAANRVKLYVNGAEVTDFDTSNNPTQNADLNCNNAGTFYIGRNFSTNYLNAYLADIHFIDGQALTPASFGETDATTGEWIPKAYTGSYGTNGFKLDFADNSNNTAATLGKDTSGNGNNWTPNNLSVTAGTGNDSLVDSPTNYGTDTGVGGEVRGNYCTLNAIDIDPDVSLKNGNLEMSQSAAGFVRGTLGVSSGKWYWEHTIVGTENIVVGASRAGAALDNFVGNSIQSVGYAGNSALFVTGPTLVGSNLSTYTNGDIIGVAMDLDGGTIKFYKNNVLQTGGYASNVTGTWFPAVGTNTTVASSYVNFGQRPFAYTAPSGFKALCSANLPTPTILNGATAMDVKLYTGNGSTQTISGLGFSPDLVWIKSRSAATDNTVYDIVRGAAERLETNNTDPRVTGDNGVQSFDSTGFTLNPLAQVNAGGITYAAWCWDGGSSTVTNTDGSLTNVRANASAGFSVLTYAGNSTGGTTRGHGLGVAPSFIIVKTRNAVNDWVVYHTSLGNQAYIVLNSTAAAVTGSLIWSSTSPTSTVFSTGASGLVNGTNNYVAYCWAPVSGYSAFGSYTGNGSADGPFIYTGFRPRWVMTKRTDTTSNWMIMDAGRNPSNVADNQLYPNLSNAEAGASSSMDLTSSGFKLRNTGTAFNANTGTYIYAAFAESPFQYARGR